MPDQASVTWLMSVRNGMPYVSQTMASIAAQTYTNHKILVWDDCSTDGTLEVLREWIPHRIAGRIFAGRSMRLGPSLAFLVEQADTELCARIDADDVSMPDRLDKQVAFLAKHPGVGVLGAHVRVIDENGAEQEIWHYDTDEAELRWLSRWQARIPHTAVMFRRSVVLAGGNYRDVKSEDQDLWFRLSLSTGMMNYPEILALYRRTSTSMCGRTWDWVPAQRQVAKDNASTLFPNINDPGEALALWEATHPDQLHLPGPVKYRQLAQFDRAAVLCARKAGAQDDYFTNTKAFRTQRWHLKLRIMVQLGFGPLMRLRMRIARSG
ncbi:MAG TPA: glycosyltransferase [Bryobacteraceae bacterium]|nr:glycosyltransferase [Bryobacteraceae bacterium]